MLCIAYTFNDSATSFTLIDLPVIHLIFFLSHILRVCVRMMVNVNEYSKYRSLPSLSVLLTLLLLWNHTVYTILMNIFHVPFKWIIFFWSSNLRRVCAYRKNKKSVRFIQGPKISRQTYMNWDIQLSKFNYTAVRTKMRQIIYSYQLNSIVLKTYSYKYNPTHTDRQVQFVDSTDKSDDKNWEQIYTYTYPYAI